MKLFLKRFWAVYFLLLFILFFLLFYPVFYWFLVIRKKPSAWKKAHKLRRLWGKIIMFLAGLNPKNKFETTIDKSKTYIIVANHFSYLDILSLNVQLPLHFRFIAKAELLKIPLFNIFFKTIDIATDRYTKKGARETIKQASESIAKGISVAIFPEGKMSRTIPKMMPYKLGAFKLAIEHQIPILPVSILDNHHRLFYDGWSKGGSPGKMRNYIHKPIKTQGMQMSDAKELSSKVYHIIESKLKQLP